MYKVVVYTPVPNADEMRRVIAEAGGGDMGNYTRCSFSLRGTGRFSPQEGAHPAIGEVGKPEEVEEERIEFVCEQSAIEQVLSAVRAAHPYEEPAIDVIRLEQL